MPHPYRVSHMPTVRDAGGVRGLGCDGCCDRDFRFDGAQAPLGYEAVGKELVHALKYKGYLRLWRK